MKIIFIRHGEPNYTSCDARGFRGQGRDLAPLTMEGIQQAEAVSTDDLLKGSELIISSPYTRAMQTAAIISKNIGISMQVEVDLHEFIPDKTFQYKGKEESYLLHKDFWECQGRYPENTSKKWESIEEIIARVQPTLEKYMNYDKIIVVAHGGVIRRFVGIAQIEYCKPYEVEFTSDFKHFHWV